MPEEFGKWESAYRRYKLWLRQGLWQRILPSAHLFAFVEFSGVRVWANNL
jgi:hypothetical protein